MKYNPSAQREPIRFHGRPDNLETLVPRRDPALVEASIELAAPTKQQPPGAPMPLQIEPIGDGAIALRFSLPDSTPPGAHQAVVQLQGERMPAVVEVEEFPQLVMTPVGVRVRAGSGATTSTPMSAVNVGNVVVSLARVQAFGVFQVHGVEESLSAAYRDPSARGLDRVATLAEELAKRHALARVVIEDGDIEVELGQHVSFTAKIRWPSKLAAGHSYAGTWPVANLRLAMRIDVPSAPAGGRRAAQ